MRTPAPASGTGARGQRQQERFATIRRRRAGGSRTLLVFALSLAAAPLGAQSGTGGAGGGAGGQGVGTADGQVDTRRNRDDGFDPGWFGLLGLAGPFALRRPRTDAPRHDYDPATPVRPR